MLSVITNTKRLRRTLHTVLVDIDSSLAAVPVDFFGVCRKRDRTRSPSSSAINPLTPNDDYSGRTELLTSKC